MVAAIRSFSLPFSIFSALPFLFFYFFNFLLFFIKVRRMSIAAVAAIETLSKLARCAMHYTCGIESGAEVNSLITPSFIGELLNLGGYPEATVRAIEKKLARALPRQPKLRLGESATPRQPKVSSLERVARVFAERWQGKLRYDRMSHRWMELHDDGEWRVDQLGKVFNQITVVCRDLSHKGSAHFCDSVRRRLQRSSEFEVFLPPVKGRRRER